ncbi:MAG TPA: hypothetical protein VMT17_11860 [Anaeromyxobacteraceae bacterium]|nr:hypothetical protein [Anaeromyxobacteraceae bacterium]
MKKAAAAVLAIATWGCIPDDGPTMHPGQNCLGCHGGVPSSTSREGGHATPWSFAGTAYLALDAPANQGVQGVIVTVTDANGWTFDVHSNLVGNFYSAESVAFPLSICVGFQGVTRCMSEPAPHGACNYCHASPPLEGAPGRIVAGGSDVVP